MPSLAGDNFFDPKPTSYAAASTFNLISVSRKSGTAAAACRDAQGAFGSSTIV
jgi:hypothetical protein